MARDAAAAGGLQTSKSLLSELMLKADLSAFEVAASEDQGSSEEDCSMSEEDGEGWGWLERQAFGDSESDRISQCSSQPVPIPTACYFKDEMQRAALDKLNQKRKWYQQQLEAERMMSKSIAKSKQGAAAAKSNKTTGRPGVPA